MRELLKRLRPSLDATLALGLGLVTFAGLLATERAIGFTRDESAYFQAGDLYAPWYLGLVDNLIHGRLADSFSDAVITRAFGYNWEHPVLMKSLFGLSHWLLSEKLDWLRPAAGYRAPAWGASGLISALIYLLGLRLFSRSAGLSAWAARGLSIFAVLAFWLTPRNLYDGHLACFDMPIAVAWVLVVYCYLRGFESRRWAILTGVAFGLALCIKHNAYFYPPAFLLHWALALAPRAFRAARWKGVLRSLPEQWLWMAALGPAIFLLHWPYLWPHPVDRISQYFAFHLNHVNYPWAYLNQLLRDPPFPLFYVVVVTALTVPLPILALMATGVVATTCRVIRAGLSGDEGDWLLVLASGLLPLALISWPTIPHFGGTKHWLPGMPFLCLIAASALRRIAETLRDLLARLRGMSGVRVDPMAAVVGSLVLGCGLIGCVHIGGYGDSAYNELAGEGAGAAELGMQRQFWSNNVTGVLDWLNHNAPTGSRVYFHEVTIGSVLAYRKNGMLRSDIQPVAGPGEAQFVPYQYMQEFRQQEFDIWNAFGSSEPAQGLYLDEAPNVTVYRRPGF